MKTQAQLKKALWEVFRKFIYQRDNNTCVTCGKRCESYARQAGHYIAKGACGLDYYFSETNVNVQCSYCNLNLEGNRHKYREYIIKKYGEDILKDIETNYHKPCPNFPFEEKIVYYKEKVLH